MPQYQYSREYQEYGTEYREYLAIRDVCRMMIALYRHDHETAANVWNKHDGPHYRIVVHAITALISYLLDHNHDPGEWARGYDAYTGGEDIAVRDICRMMIALYQENDDKALDVWNEHEGPHVRLAMEAIDGLTSYFERDGKDLVEWACGYEAYAAKQANCQPYLTREVPEAAAGEVIYTDQPDGLITLAIDATKKQLDIDTTKDDWEYCPGDDTSDGHPYVQHQITTGRLWLRVTGGMCDDDGQPAVWCRIWCPEVLGGDASVPMEEVTLAGLQLLVQRAR